MNQTITISYSANYGDTPRDLMENVILPFLDGLEAGNETATFSLRITGRKRKITGIKTEIDQSWDGMTERRRQPR